MWSNSIGKAFTVTCFGESHGPGVGVTIDGCPAGLQLTEEIIQTALNRRLPEEKEVASARREPDIVEIFSGVFQDHTTGAPITLHIRNREARSSDYESLKDVIRPGHADYPAKVKYGGFSDYRGGGRLSGRMTAAFVAAGSVASRLLENFGVEVLSYTHSVGQYRLDALPSSDNVRKLTYEDSMRCPDPSLAEKMRVAVLDAKAEGDSLGGIVECCVNNLPVGVGEPLFDSLDAELAKILFGIPAVKGVEFGAGFEASRLKGSQNNDQFTMKDGKIITVTNNSGGESTLEVRGRHDPCVVPKAVPVVQAMVSIEIADLMIRGGMIPRVLKS